MLQNEEIRVIEGPEPWVLVHWESPRHFFISIFRVSVLSFFFLFFVWDLFNKVAWLKKGAEATKIAWQAMNAQRIMRTDFRGDQERLLLGA